MAKEIVTGKIGSEDVTLNNAASEATLKSLLNAIEKIPGAKSPADAKKAREEVVKQAKASKKAAKETKEFGEEIDETTNLLEDFGGAVKTASNVFGGLVGGISSAISGLVRFTKHVAIGGDRISDFFGELPVIGIFANAIDANIDSFRRLSAVGATFENSLLNMRSAAARAQLPLEDFQRIVTSNAQTLAVLESSSSSGAKRFSEISQQLRVSDVGKQLMGMGFTAEALNEHLATYLELEARRNRLNFMSDQQIRQGAAEYAKNLQQLSKLTGIQRDELEQNMLAQQTEARFRLMRSQAVDKEAFDANLAMLQSMGPLGGALMDLADGVAETDEAQALLAAGGPAAMRLAQQMGQGALSAAESRKRLAELGVTLENFSAGIGFQGMQSVFMAYPALGAVLNDAIQLQRLNLKAEENMTEQELEARESLTESFASFEQSMYTIRSRLLLFAFDNAIFRSIVKNLERFAGLFTPENVGGILDLLEEPLQRFNRWFGRFIDDFKKNIEEEDLWFAIKKAFGEISANIRTYVFGDQSNPDSRGLVGSLQDWYDTSGLKAVFQNMANDITKMFHNSLFGRELTDRESEEYASIVDEYKNLPTILKGQSEEYRQHMLEEGRITPEQLAHIENLESQIKTYEMQMKGMLGFIPGIGNEGGGPGFWNKLFRGFSTGTGGIENFGKGTPAMLHGRESVLTEDQLFNMANGVYSSGLSNSQSGIAASIDTGFQRVLTKHNLAGQSSIAASIDTGFRRVLTKIDTDNFKKTNSSFDKVSENLNDINLTLSQLKNLNQPDAYNRDSNNTVSNENIDKLNTTMASILNVLNETYNINKKQNENIRGLSGNLFRGVPG